MSSFNNNNANMSIGRVKSINQQTKDLVFGFIRNLQKLLASNNDNIATLIKHICVLYFSPLLESKMLSYEKQDKFFNFFYKNNKLIESKFILPKLIYLATRDGFNDLSFKKICHDQSNLLCILYSKDNNIFGGFTQIGWRGSPEFEGQKDENAFIFSFKSSLNYKPAIFNPRTSDDHLGNQKDYYCMFGWNNLAFSLRTSSNICDGSPISGDYEKYPNDFYLFGGKYRTEIKEIEVFQMK